MVLAIAEHRPKAGRDSYDDIEPWLAKLAALEHDDPARATLREDIVRRCLPLADHIARRFTGRGEHYDDLHQIASVGLVLAVDRFDPDRGCSFLAFAIPTIMGEVRRHFRDHTWAVRVPRRVKELQLTIGPTVEALSQRLGRTPSAYEIAIELDVDFAEVTQALLAGNAYRTNSLDTVPQDDDAGASTPASRVMAALGTEDAHYELTEDALAVLPLLDELPERERHILYARFFRNRTQSQIAEELGVSQMQISRILSRTLTALRDRALRD
ncbi:SigB/SigF/SigG family RNA polymerase sigma factor [Nocardia puris]|uniref:RNA polymerase sigma-B factor n=1 Tax=Nocardia puris TaxID=208602 RepID=A0A366DWN0_9NOCA|nr:SigB/SigF/SigG family RNA polymerase sigma factor [Nocardia puris]MBF6209771.1 SigB/SigF/SigG family RNA polymerase sigma factor [Nocardia puris]MBF6366343.1 SigB/SigF/SigG family RNA polymerase sigma factor [Nocardia puris]MBF6458318.1 SigB/SigF/SigG family RNA polymerase sigma factor [Nocardia puris]RBO94493.1 RNA polymerase sigma-B factor [Nocardia puris]